MISVTFLSSYEYCPRKLYLTQVMKVVVPPKEVLVKGKIRHEIHDNINKAEEPLVRAITTKDFKSILDTFKQKYAEITRSIIIRNKGALNEVNLELSETFKSTWPLILYESEQRVKNIYSFIKKTGLLGEELWLNLSPKIKSEYRLESENLRLKGIVDQIEVYENKIVPYELKTGKTPRKGVWPGHKLQMAAYLLLLGEVLGNKIDIGYINYLDTKEIREVILNPFLEHEVHTTKNKVIELFNRDNAPEPIKQENKCKICELYGQCY
ncbi:CRISPR-associated protein Cas4 [Candidatus Woesearchaeota archaeon]|nr:CRISPR-associated protein Cas4 [Candidatus Woesearchaeota archaeon]